MFLRVYHAAVVWPRAQKRRESASGRGKNHDTHYLFRKKRGRWSPGDPLETKLFTRLPLLKGGTNHYTRQLGGTTNTHARHSQKKKDQLCAVRRSESSIFLRRRNSSVNSRDVAINHYVKKKSAERSKR